LTSDSGSAPDPWQFAALNGFGYVDIFFRSEGRFHEGQSQIVPKVCTGTTGCSGMGLEVVNPKYPQNITKA
jgi:hypothetical protein